MIKTPYTHQGVNISPTRLSSPESWNGLVVNVSHMKASDEPVFAYVIIRSKWNMIYNTIIYTVPQRFKVALNHEFHLRDIPASLCGKDSCH